jgi:uncharacterized membrane protein YphA (DoxX/SURF4 family)
VISKPYFSELLRTFVKVNAKQNNLPHQFHRATNMKQTALNRAYWIATIIFALLLVMDGLGGVMRAEPGKESLAHLGYPMYLLTIVGVAKLLAAIAIVQTKFQTIKEWAFAGFAINCYGALCSRIAVGDAIGEIIFPIVFLAIMTVPYWLWKKLDASKAA